MKTKKTIILAIFFLVLLSGCSVNSVTKQQIENVKTGDVLVYRYKKNEGKTWFYADKITRIEGNRIFYNPSKSEATAGNDYRLSEFLMDKELIVNKEDLLKYSTEQGDEQKVIVWIK